MNIEIIEKKLKQLVKKAIKKDEVPIAALIVHNNRIISEAFNLVNKKNNFMYHAEIIAINKAMKKLKNWRLNNCDLYVTLEPCLMCKEIIKKSRIKKVFYFCKQNNEKTESDISLSYIENNLFSDELKKFFKEKR